MSKRILGLCLFTLLVCLCGTAFGQDQSPSDYQVESVSPTYLPPYDILSIIGAEADGNQSVLRWRADDRSHRVDIKVNDASNVIILCGEQSDIDFVKALIQEADVSPHQIEIEVKMVEIYTDQAKDIGLDWESLIQSGAPSIAYDYNDNKYSIDYLDQRQSSSSGYSFYHDSDERMRINRDYRIRGQVEIGRSLSLLQESGAGRIFNAPKIITINNHRATILDGSRTTYVAQMSSYSNIYEIDSMDAGITLSVLPSIGKSGFMTLDITAEVTTMSLRAEGGSPTKNGQIIENKIIINDGQSVILGGMTRTIQHKSRKRFPILGHILPFLFSRETSRNEEVQTIMVLTPRIINLETNMDESSQKLLEGEEKK